LTTTRSLLTAKRFKKIAGMDGTRLPTWRVVRHLLHYALPNRALTTWCQAEDFNIRRHCAYVDPAERRLRDAGDIVTEMVELVVHRQPDAGAVCRLLKNKEIAVQASSVGDRTAGASPITANPLQRVYDPPIDPNLTKARRHVIQVMPLGRKQHGHHH